MEKEFFEFVLQHRARMYCGAVMTNLLSELELKCLTQTRGGIFFIMMNQFLRQLLEWMNEQLRLEKANGRGSIKELHARHVSFCRCATLFAH